MRIEPDQPIDCFVLENEARQSLANCDRLISPERIGISPAVSVVGSRANSTTTSDISCKYRAWHRAQALMTVERASYRPDQALRNQVDLSVIQACNS